MKIYTEQSLKDFEVWSGAVYTVEHLTDEQLDILENILNEMHPDGLSDIELNDFLWFETDTIAEWLGFEDWDNLLENQI